MNSMPNIAGGCMCMLGDLMITDRFAGDLLQRLDSFLDCLTLRTEDAFLMMDAIINKRSCNDILVDISS